MYEFSSDHLKLDGIWEFVFSQFFWGQVVIDKGDDFDWNSIVKSLYYCNNFQIFHSLKKT